VRLHPLLALALLGACAESPALPQVTRADSAGIEIVTNPGTDRTLDWAIVPRDTLLDAASDTLLQGEARTIRAQVDEAENLYFLDGPFTDRRILRRGTDGSDRQVGKRGGGPGEYDRVGGFAAAPSGEVLVVDHSKRAFVRFEPTGIAGPNIPWARFGSGSVQLVIAADGGYAFTIDQRTDSTSSVGLQFIRGADSLELLRLPGPPPKEQYYESCKVSVMLPPLYFATILWTGNASAVAANAGAGYRIDVWRDGLLVRSIRRAVAPRPMTRTEAIADLGEGLPIYMGGPTPCLLPATDMVEQRGFAPVLPAIKRLTMARDGTIWAERWSLRGEPQLRDVFDPTGSYLGTFAGDAPWPQAWLRNGEYLAIAANEDSLPLVIRYGVGGATRQE
jgi:hypothetical protein